MGADELERRIPGWCALCRSRCGGINVVRDGRLVAVEPDPRHPTGRALCAKGRAAPELVHHPERLMRPLMRSRPKGDADPGWREIPWDEALDRTAAALKRFADESGPESVVFAPTTPSGTAISDAIHWIERLIRAYGSPNNLFGTEICNWHKDVAHRYTFGAAVGTPDFGRVGCLVLWGHNPSAAWLAQAERAAEARRRGAKLVVVDPRRVGLAAKADQWLRVRPGSDGALALAIAGVMIEAGWYDEAFVRDWTNAAFLVRDDEDRLLTECDLIEGGRPDAYVAWDEEAARPVAFDCAAGAYDGPIGRTRLRGTIEVPAAKSIACRPVFERFAALCGSLTPERAAAITWVPAERIRATARLLWEARPVAYHAWSGVGQHTNATQTERAIACLYALTGSFDAPGGNAYFARIPVNDVAGAELMTEAQAAKALGLKERPLGPAKD
ncbi:MAG: molybdopterin-dependent oxidoreductase [Alphaproteobacteria bacterium]|nr:molybdopterin-dependent oxidoreductase [Alphaproteobacteria bacterium]